MKKIVNPCKCKVYDMRCEIREVPAFVKIEYKEKSPGRKRYRLPALSVQCEMAIVSEVADNVLMKSTVAFRLTVGMSI